MENSSKLENDMIAYAIKKGVKVTLENGWKLFKLQYDCTNTSAELLHKFWDEIMPNIGTYSIVVQNPAFISLLKDIPRPDECRRLHVVSNNRRITRKNRHYFLKIFGASLPLVT